MKKLLKGLAVFLCAFTMLSGIITYVLILNTSNQANEVYSEKEQGIDLYGTYDQNDLIINDLVEKYNGVEIKIPKLEGLKDKSIQDKVNQDIYNRAYETIKKYHDITYADYYAYSNFANVISIGFFTATDTENEQIYFNYNLKDGERLKLEDIFIKDADITGIVRSAFYEELAKRNWYGSENSMVSIDENEIYKVVKGYMSSEDKIFSFTPSQVYFYYNDYMAAIKMIDFAESVAIYNKYLTEESLYTKDDIGFKNIFTCATSSYEGFEKIEYGYLEDNFWYDISVFKGYMPQEFDDIKSKHFESFKVNIYNEVYEKIKEYREIAKQNPNNFYILFSKPNVNVYSNSNYEKGKWNYTYSNMAITNKNIQIFEMPISVYENVYKDKLIDTYRYEYFVMRGGAYLDTEAKDGATIKLLDERKLYNYITGEEIKEVTDVFFEESAYIEVIRQKTKESLIEKYNYLDVEVEELLEDINYELDGEQINVTISGVEDFMRIIYFSEFDVSMMKIF